MAKKEASAPVTPAPTKSKKERPVLPTQKEIDAAKAKAKPEVTLESREAKLRDKYSDKKIVKGSIEFDSDHNKYSVEMKLDCGHTGRVFTSDVFQVKACHDCKKAKAKAKLAELKGKTPAKGKDAPAAKAQPKAQAQPKAPAKAVKATTSAKAEQTEEEFAPPPNKKASKVAALLQ